MRLLLHLVHPHRRLHLPQGFNIIDVRSRVDEQKLVVVYWVTGLLNATGGLAGTGYHIHCGLMARFMIREGEGYCSIHR